jgi:hypothetical protein
MNAQFDDVNTEPATTAHKAISAPSLTIIGRGSRKKNASIVSAAREEKPRSSQDQNQPSRHTLRRRIVLAAAWAVCVVAAPASMAFLSFLVATHWLHSSSVLASAVAAITGIAIATGEVHDGVRFCRELREFMSKKETVREEEGQR